MSFATADDLEVFLGQSMDSVRAELLLGLASEAVLNTAPVPIVATADDEATLDGTGATMLLLPAWPVTDVQAVTIDGAPVADFTWTRSGELRRVSSWPRGSRVVVTYSHGFDPIPEGIKLATLQAAARLAGNPQSLGQFSGDGAAMNFNSHVGTLTVDEAALVLRAIR